jgi:hypothetical protein
MPVHGEHVVDPAQAPAWHVSLQVLAFPSSQEVPFFSLASAGQVGELPVQVSALSQTDVAGRHVDALVLKPSLGQTADVPVHFSAASQSPAASRQTVPALPARCEQLPLLQASTVQGLSSLQSVARMQRGAWPRSLRYRPSWYHLSWLRLGRWRPRCSLRRLNQKWSGRRHSRRLYPPFRWHRRLLACSLQHSATWPEISRGKVRNNIGSSFRRPTPSVECSVLYTQCVLEQAGRNYGSMAIKIAQARRSSNRGRLVFAPLALTLILGCNGEISGIRRADSRTDAVGGSASSTGGAGGGISSIPGTAGTDGTVAASQQPLTGMPTAQACTTNSPGPRKLRRLTAPQFSATLKNLFNDPSVPSVTVFSDPQVLGLSNDADALVVEGLSAQQIADYAEQVAHWAVTTKLSSLSSCSTMDSACRESFLKSFGKKAFREPLSADRMQAYEGLMTAESSFSNGVEAAITAMLQSPYFLYRRELGPDAAGSGLVNLTPYEVASSLSYLLVGSMPDAQLMSAADNGALSSKSDLDQQAARLLQDPRSLNIVMDFFASWLGLGRLDTTIKDDTVFEISDSLKADMKGEASAFLLDLFNNGGTVSDLFAANYSFLNQELAEFYGVTPPSGTTLGTSFSKVPYGSGGHRDGGILAQAGMLTGYADAAISSPVLRGKLVRVRLLCESLPPPPSNLNTKLEPPAMTETTRQHFEAHTQNPVCAACHQKMDPIGFGFEHYDAFGRWRDQENGIDVDASGTIIGTPSGDVKFNGLADLSSHLASSDAVKACAVRFWAYYAYGSSSWDQDACTYGAIQSEAASGTTKLRDVLMGIVHAPHFTQRLSQ